MTAEDVRGISLKARLLAWRYDGDNDPLENVIPICIQSKAEAMEDPDGPHPPRPWVHSSFVDECPGCPDDYEFQMYAKGECQWLYVIQPGDWLIMLCKEDEVATNYNLLAVLTNESFERYFRVDGEPQ